MGVIQDTENALLTACESALGNTVRVKETVPGGWTLDLLRRALQRAPGVFVTWHGGQRADNFSYINGRFSVYVVTKGATDKARREGSQAVIGAYEMVERLVPVLDGLDVADVGSLTLQGVDNLFRDALFDLGGTVYGLQLQMTNMPFEIPDPDNLGDFVTFSGDWNLGPEPDGEIDASDTITLEQDP